MCFPAREIERDRLASIAATWRLIGARRIPINTPSEWTGWQAFDPAADRRLYAERAAAGLCTRCGKLPPRPDCRTCERCALDAALRSERHRRRNGKRRRVFYLRGDAAAAQGLCSKCGRRPPVDGGRTCETCRKRQRANLAAYRERRRGRQET